MRLSSTISSWSIDSDMHNSVFINQSYPSVRKPPLVWILQKVFTFSCCSWIINEKKEKNLDEMNGWPSNGMWRLYGMHRTDGMCSPKIGVLKTTFTEQLFLLKNIPLQCIFQILYTVTVQGFFALLLISYLYQHNF